LSFFILGIGLTDTREVDGIANTPTDQYRFNVKKFEELAGFAEKLFCGKRVGARCGNILCSPKCEHKVAALSVRPSISLSAILVLDIILKKYELST
jgi:hypothetical protein